MLAVKRTYFLMATCLVFAIGTLMSAICHWPLSQTSASTELPILQGEAASIHLSQQELTQGLQQAFNAARYNVHPNVQTDGGYFANNPAQAYQAGFGPHGLSLRAAETSGQNWQLGLELTGIGYGTRQKEVSAGKLRAQGQRVELTRDVVTSGEQTAQVTEWFVNAATGLEHGISLNAPPGKAEAGERLHVRLRLRGSLRAEAEVDGQAVRMVQANGRVALRYEHLAVRDAAGKLLEAQLTVSGDELGVEVAEEGAIYPVTIDPTFAQQAYLKASNTNAGDFFGHVVAISGDTVVIGAPFEASNATGVNGNQADNSATDAGAAYVFVRSGTTWSQQAYLKASNTNASDQFGTSVAISGDTLVVGARGEDSNASGVNGNQGDNSAASAGAAYVFVRSGTSWSQQAYLKASNTNGGDFFGHAAAISGDTIVIGAVGEASNATGVNGNQADNSADGAGAAYVFVRSGTVWSQQAYLKASNTNASDNFGNTVAISGGTIVVGAPFEASNATGVNGNQTDNSATDAGAAYVFVRNGTVWSQQAYLKASNTNAGDTFGYAVAISGDTVVAGAYAEDSNASGVNGNQADNSATDAGAAYVFVRSGTNWSQQAYLKASNTNGGDFFGHAAAISGDTIVIGAHFEDSSATGVDGNQADNSANAAGAAYVFVRSGTNWSQQAYLKASNTNAFDNFGYAVAVSGDTVVIGADSEDSNATGVNGNQADNSAAAAGAAYVFLGSGTSGLQFYPLAHPVRLLDTRPGQTGCDAPGAQISGGSSRMQTAAGRTCDGLTIPANAKALTGNITTVESGGGFLTLYPSDVTRPLVANSNFAANQVLNNVFTVGLGASDGAFNIYVTTNTNVVVDVTGYYAPPSASGLYFHPLPHPVRLMDSRVGATACFTPGAQLSAGSTTTQLGQTTCDGVLIPGSAQALVGNATTVNSQANGFLTLFPADAMRPLAASSNFQTGINMNAPFTVGLSQSGQFNIYTAATTDLVVDVLGYFSTQVNDSNGQGLLFNPLPTPVRLLDTRAAGATGCFTPGAQMIGGTSYLQSATGVCTGIPAAAKAVVGNATTVNVSANGFLTFWPSDASQPIVATSNYRSGAVFNRHFTVGLGADGAFKRFAATTTDLVIDLSGYFAP